MMEAQCVISSEREAYELHTWYTDDKDPHHRQVPVVVNKHHSPDKLMPKLPTQRVNMKPFNREGIPCPQHSLIYHLCYLFNGCESQVTHSEWR